MEIWAFLFKDKALPFFLAYNNLDNPCCYHESYFQHKWIYLEISMKCFCKCQISSLYLDVLWKQKTRFFLVLIVVIIDGGNSGGDHACKTCEAKTIPSCYHCKDISHELLRRCFKYLLSTFSFRSKVKQMIRYFTCLKHICIYLSL